MFDQLQIMLIGLAAVIDTGLLLALVERRNWPQVAMPVFVLVAGSWMLHAGAFGRLLLFDMLGAGAEHVHWLATLVMTAGVLVVPSALVHGCWRLWRTGFQSPIASSKRYLLAYLPAAILLPLAMLGADEPRRQYTEVTAPLVLPYAAWLCLSNFGSAACLLFIRRRWEIPHERRFFAWLAGVLIAIGLTQTAVLIFALPAFPAWRSQLELVALLTPTCMAMLFCYFILRYNFMQLMLERTLVYAAILVAVMLFHHVVFRDLNDRLQERYRVDFGLLEAIVLLGLVVAYRPLRQRISEALRYLLGARVEQVREQTRALAVRLSSWAGYDVRALLALFCQDVEKTLAVRYAAAWLFDSTGRETLACGAADRLTGHAARELARAMHQAGQHLWTPRDAPRHLALQLLAAEATLAARIDHPAVAGLLVLGRRHGNHEFSDEEANAVVLLVEQLGMMLHNSSLQTERLDAERRALQNEKLSTLGLLSSSIAHEIKNPLSSIKTIAAVMAEELGPDSSHAEDLRLILGEVDRLAQTTAQLLAFVRPAVPSNRACSAVALLEGTLSVMRHWARERGIIVETEFDAGPALVAADEASLREVFFNLLRNAIEATDEQGRVAVSCRTQLTAADDARVVVEIRDTGGGIAPEVQDRLFEPFITTKASGTGLGLYLVGQRMRAIGGEVQCRSSPSEGTRFTITLPAAPVEAAAIS